jgi:hypothetical protein
METSINYKVLLGKIERKLSKRTVKSNNKQGTRYFDIVDLGEVINDIEYVIQKEYERQQNQTKKT